MVRQRLHQFSQIWFRLNSFCLVWLVTQGLQLTKPNFKPVLLASWWGCHASVVFGSFSPQLCWRVVVYCISISFSNKLRHLWWSNFCQTLLAKSLLMKPFSKQAGCHAVLVYSFILQHPCNSIQHALLSKYTSHKCIWTNCDIGHSSDSVQNKNSKSKWLLKEGDRVQELRPYWIKIWQLQRLTPLKEGDRVQELRPYWVKIWQRQRLTPCLKCCIKFNSVINVITTNLKFSSRATSLALICHLSNWTIFC